MASFEPLGGGAGAAAITGATSTGSDLPRPCFLAARPHVVTEGRLCLQTPPDSSPVYNNAADEASEAIESVKWMERDAAGKASDANDSAVEPAGTDKDKTVEAASEGGLGNAGEANNNAVEGGKSAGENMVDTAEDGASKVAEPAQGLGGWEGK